MRTLKNKTDPFKIGKQETLILTFDSVNLTKIYDFEEIVSTTFHNFELIADKVNIIFILIFIQYLKIDNLIFYHKNPTNLLYNNQRTKFLELKGFRIDFTDNSNIKIDFKEIKINYYTIELSFLIAKIVMYYQFLPEWIDWQMDGQFLIDKENRDIFIQNSARIKSVEILFSLITVEISENSLATIGIFESDIPNYDIKDKKGLKDVLKELKSLRKEFSFHIILRNFGIKVYNYLEENTKNYYDKINQENNFKYFDSTMKSKIFN